MSVQIQLRRGLAADWTTADPVLAEGEAGYETDTGLMKIGDGTSAWSALSYFAGGSGGGSGTVTSVSVATANGFAGTVANATTTPAITIRTSITGLLKGNGTAISAAAAGTDYLAPSGSGAALTGITWSQIGGTPTTLAGYGITDAQPLDAELTALAGLVSAADRLPYFTGSGTAALATFTAAGRALVDDADATAQRATLGLATVAATGAYSDLSGKPTLGTAAALNVPASGDAAVGEVVKGSDSRLTDARTPTAHNQAWSTITSTPTTLSGYGIADAQPLDNELTALAGVTAAANKLPYFTSGSAAALADLTAAGRALIDDADAATQRSTLGLATIASSFFYPSPVNGTVPMSAKAAFAMTISQIRGLKTSSGTLTLSIQINGTNVTGLSGLSVTSTPQDVSATAANAVAAGDRVTVVIASVSSAADLEFTLSSTR